MKRNQYDYNKMIRDFEVKTRQEKIANNIRNKWKAATQSYIEKIEEMKLKNEKLYKERDRAFKLKLKKKELAIKKQLQLRNDKLIQKKKAQEEISKRRSDDILKNIEDYNKKQEEIRLQLEKETFLKCN
jgi:hypothetical protein